MARPDGSVEVTSHRGLGYHNALVPNLCVTTVKNEKYITLHQEVNI